MTAPAITRRQLGATAVVVGLLVAVETWPSRSRYLFSWDSANFAFGMSGIDIALSRPHPPGYLGYVLVGRLLAAFTHDPNTALIVWNILALSAAGACIAWLCASTTDAGGWGALAASVLLVTSPLVWFYTSVSEIYISELLVTLVIACAAWAALNGSVRAMYWLAAALAGAAVFKMPAMVLMLPLAAFSWCRGPARAKTRSALLLVVLLGGVAAIFLTAEPRFVSVLWADFVAATAQSRLIGGTLDLGIGRALNRNVRDTLTASLAAVGFVNGCAFVLWLLVDRHLPPGLRRPFVAFWAIPWLAVFVFIHIGKPGYVLPLFPLACLVLVGFLYSRLGRTALFTAVVLQAVANFAYVTLLSPPVSNPSNSGPRYADKTFLQRMASNLQPLTIPTLATIVASDDRIDQLLALQRNNCPSGEWMVVAGVEPVDWRRAMYYLPRAQAIYVPSDEHPVFIGQNGDFTVVPALGVPIASDCGLLWIGVEPPPYGAIAVGARPLSIGWLLAPGSGRVTRDVVTWTRH